MKEVYVLGGILFVVAYIFVVSSVLKNTRSPKNSGFFMLLLYVVTLAFLFDHTPTYEDRGGSKEDEDDYDYTQIIDGFDYDYDFTDNH